MKTADSHEPIVLNVGEPSSKKEKTAQHIHLATFAVIFFGWVLGLFVLASVLFAAVQLTGLKHQVTAKLASLQK